jgi:flagellar hook-associated protein 3 FlgL
LANLDAQISSGLTFSRPGENPIGTEQVMNANTLLSGIERYTDNITTANLWLSTAESALKGITGFLDSIKGIAYSLNNGTNDIPSRTTAISNLQQFRDQIKQLANTQLDGQYIFAGFNTSQQPFNPADATHTYTGTDDSVRMEIDRGVLMPVNYTGDAILRGGTPPGSTGMDVLAVIDNVINALAADNVAALQAELPNLNKSFDQVQSFRSDLAGRQLRLKSTANVHTVVKNNLKDVVGNIMNVDYAKTITLLNTQKTAFDATLASSAKISQLSLLDYLK